MHAFDVVSREAIPICEIESDISRSRLIYSSGLENRDRSGHGKAIPISSQMCT